MRFVWAVLAFVLALLLIGAGIGQRTIFMGPDSQQEEIAISEPAAYTLIDGAVLRAHPGLQSLIIRSEGEIFAAYGRTADMRAWLSDATYNAVALDDEGAIVVELTEPTVVPEEPADDAEEGADDAEDTAAAGRNPAGSDLWLDSFSDKDQLITDMQLPDGMSVLIALDGTAPAPDDIVISWPLDTSTPLAGPLMVAGGVVMAIGLVLYILGIRHQRRGRGPLRKGPGPLPPTEPIELDAVEERRAIEAGSPDAPQTADADEPVEAEIVDEGDAKGAGTAQRTAVSSRRRRLALPALGLAAVMMTGCSPDSWPQFDAATPTPSATPTVVAPENQKPPAVTEAQASRILQSIASTLATADEERDIDLAATRLDGAALDARRTTYTLLEKVEGYAAPAAIPTDALEIVLPQATEAWPRTVLVLSRDTSEETAAPLIMTMTQADPWSNYRISSMAEMQASAELLDVAPTWLGTTLVPPDLTFLAVAPAELAAAFASVVDQGDKSAHLGLFDETALALATSIQESRAGVVQGLKDKGAEKTSKVSFSIAPTDKAPVSLATLDSGAIVTVSLVDSEKVEPTSDDAVIKLGENPNAKALTGVEESAKGFTTTYGLQLFFAVPAQGSTEPVRLLAVHQDLLDVKVIE